MRCTLILLLLASILLSTCKPAPTLTPKGTDIGAPQPSLTPQSNDLSRNSASELADYITQETLSLTEAIQATQEILARGGIAIGDLKETYLPAHTPASSLVLTPREVLQLAQEAQGGSSVWRMDLAEFGEMLSDLGWPTEGEETPGKQLAALLFAWSAEAARSPQEAENFTPLFLIAMAKHRAPGVVFSSGVVAPEDIRLGFLEMMLFIAAFDRLIPMQSAAHFPGAQLISLLSVGAASSVAQLSPCKPFQDSLFGRLVYSDVVSTILQLVTGKALEEGLRAAGISEWGQDRIGKAMFALGMLARVLRAVLMTAYVRIGVSLEGDRSVHKPLEGEQLQKTFHAQAGIPPQDWQAFREQFGKSFHDALRECLAWLGIPTYTLDDLVRQMETWAIEWRIEEGSEGHARWSPDQQIVPGQVHQGYWRTPLVRAGTGDVVGRSSFVVEVRNEKERDHPGILLEAPVTVCAFLDVAQMPGFSTFANAAAGGLAGVTDSVVELLIGMMEKISKRKDCENLQVSYHIDCITALWDIQKAALKPDQAVLDRLRKCLTFELKFESQVEFVEITDKGSVRYKGLREATVGLKLDFADFKLKGQAPLNPTATLELTTAGGPCATSLTTTKPGTFRVFSLEFVFFHRIQTDEVIVQDLKLNYDPGDPLHEPRETFTVSCPKAPTVPMDTQAFWATGYMFGHSAEIGSEGRVANGWNILGGEEYARKKWSTRGDAGGAFTESGRFVLYHRPEE